MSAQQQQSSQSLTPEQLVAAQGILDVVIKKTEQTRAAQGITITDTGVSFQTFEGVQRYARMLVHAGFVPEQKSDTEESMIARASICILLGRRIGLSPEQSLNQIYVVNCKPTLYGDAPLAIARQHKDWVEGQFLEYFEVDGEPYVTTGPDGKRVFAEPPPEAFKKDDTAAVCQTMRRGASAPITRRFSIGHAKMAGLFGRNSNLYGGYPQRMLRFRARGYNIRDNFGDALQGLGIKELVDDITETNEVAEPATPARPEGRINLRARPANGNGSAATSKSDPLPAPTSPPEPGQAREPQEQSGSEPEGQGGQPTDAGAQQEAAPPALSAPADEGLALSDDLNELDDLLELVRDEASYQSFLARVAGKEMFIGRDRADHYRQAAVAKMPASTPMERAKQRRMKA